MHCLLLQCNKIELPKFERLIFLTIKMQTRLQRAFRKMHVVVALLHYLNFLVVGGRGSLRKSAGRQRNPCEIVAVIKEARK